MFPPHTLLPADAGSVFPPHTLLSAPTLSSSSVGVILRGGETHCAHSIDAGAPIQLARARSWSWSLARATDLSRDGPSQYGTRSEPAMGGTQVAVTGPGTPMRQATRQVRHGSGCAPSADILALPPPHPLPPMRQAAHRAHLGSDCTASALCFRMIAPEICVSSTLFVPRPPTPPPNPPTPHTHALAHAPVDGVRHPAPHRTPHPTHPPVYYPPRDFGVACFTPASPTLLHPLSHIPAHACTTFRVGAGGLVGVAVGGGE